MKQFQWQVWNSTLIYQEKIEQCVTTVESVFYSNSWVCILLKQLGLYFTHYYTDYGFLNFANLSPFAKNLHFKMTKTFQRQMLVFQEFTGFKFGEYYSRGQCDVINNEWSLWIRGNTIVSSPNLKWLFIQICCLREYQAFPGRND